MKILTVCFVCVFLLSGCGMLDDLRQRIAVAEDNVNKSTREMEDAREKFDERQAVVNEKQAAMEAAISKGDFETATRLTSEISAARIDAAKADDALREAEKNTDQLKDLKNAAIYEYENSTSPWDYIMGGIVLLASVFGVGGTLKGVSERQKRKIAEENQLNPRPNTN